VLPPIERTESSESRGKVQYREGAATHGATALVLRPAVDGSGPVSRIFWLRVGHDGDLEFKAKKLPEWWRKQFAATERDASSARKEETVYRVQGLRNAARVGGFIEVNGAAEGTVLWLRKSKPDLGRDTYQRMCVDGLTNSATVYWTDLPGKINSKTFRGVPALEEWLKSEAHTFAQR
jgi:hypothetical protein